MIGFILYYSVYANIIYTSNRYRKQNDVALYVFSSIIGLLAIEYFQVTYLYGLPWVFLSVAMSYCKKDNVLNDWVREE